MTPHARPLVMITAFLAGVVGPSVVTHIGYPGLALVVTLATCAVASARRKSARSARPIFGLAFTAALPVVLGVGAAFNRPRLLEEATTGRTWLVIAVGTVSFAICAQLARGPAATLRDQRSMRPILSSRQLDRVNLVSFAALFVAAINLATGDVSLLSGSTSSVRFAGQFGVLERVWPLVFGALQAAFVLRIVGRRQGFIRLPDALILICTTLVFVLTSGRAFLALALGAVAIEIIERRRIGVATVFALLLCGALLAGTIGYARTTAEFGEVASEASLRQQNLPAGPLGSTLQSLVIGPRVLSRVVYTVPGQEPHRWGGFFLADGLNFLNSDVERSDRWVTLAIMKRDPLLVGGQPPTLLGGLWIDFGWLGVVFGTGVLGWITQRLYARARAARTAVASSVFGYWSAYLLLSLYSYVSLKPQFLAALAVFWFVQHASSDRLAAPAEQAMAAR